MCIVWNEVFYAYKIRTCFSTLSTKNGKGLFNIFILTSCRNCFVYIGINKHTKTNKIIEINFFCFLFLFKFLLFNFQNYMVWAVFLLDSAILSLLLVASRLTLFFRIKTHLKAFLWDFCPTERIFWFHLKSNSLNKGCDGVFPEIVLISGYFTGRTWESIASFNLPDLECWISLFSFFILGYRSNTP